MSVMQWAAVSKYVKPDMDKKVKSYTALSVFGFILGIAGFVSFALFGILVVVRFGFEYFPYIVIPFVCFPAGMATGMVSLAKKAQFKALLGVAEQIKQYDRVLIVKLVPSAAGTYFASDYVLLIKKLIETKNLEGYEVVADVVVAKTELHVSEYDAKQEYEEYVKLQNGIVEEEEVITECPSCGAPVENLDAKFCQYCGKILK